MCIRDRLDPIEVDTFPTLLIAVSGRPVFFGALAPQAGTLEPVSYTHLRAHETVLDLVCRLLLEKKNAHRSTQT